MTKKAKRLLGESAIDDAVSLLEAGECVALPTETVYGLGAKADNPQAVAKVFQAKERPTNHPLIVHIADAASASSWARSIPEDFHKLAAAFWPGPLTMIVKRSERATDSITGGLDSVALRVPSHPLFLGILKKLQSGVVAPSANKHKQLSPVAADQVLASLGDEISAVVDGGRCPVGLESTILDLTQEKPSILRSGPITRQQIEAVLGRDVNQPQSHSIQVPGNMKAHYQPRAKLQILERHELSQRFQTKPASDDIFLVYSEESLRAVKEANIPSGQVFVISASPMEYGSALYHTLDQADRAGARNIFVEKTPTAEDWLAVNDRLTRAQG